MSENNILVYCETVKGELAAISTEALAAGRMLAKESGAKIIGVAIGKEANKIAKDAICYGADDCYVADLPECGCFWDERAASR